MTNNDSYDSTSHKPHNPGPVLVYKNDEDGSIRNSVRVDSSPSVPAHGLAEKPGTVSDGTRPVQDTYAYPTADEIIAMSAEEIQKLVVRQLIDRVKCRLAVINAEEADQKAEENLNLQKQYDTYCGADNCVCLEDRLEDPSAIRDDDKDVNGRNDANDSNDEDDVLWDWNGGIWC